MSLSIIGNLIDLMFWLIKLKRQAKKEMQGFKNNMTQNLGQILVPSLKNNGDHTKYKTAKSSTDLR